MGTDTPHHLKTLTISCNLNNAKYFQENKEWFNSLDWKGQLMFDGQTKFNVFYSGEKYDDGLISTQETQPLIIWTKPIHGEERIVVFDERIHGYEALLIEKKDFTVPIENQFFGKNGEVDFEVFIWTNSSIDFEDEFQLNGNGEILTLDNKFETIEYLRNNAFDYIGILLKDEKSIEIKIVDMELA